MPIPRKFIPASQRRAVFAPVPGRPGVKRFIGFEGDPGTRGLSGLSGRTADRDGADFPARDGTPGPMVYDESSVWGASVGTTVGAPIDPSTAIAPIPGPAVFDPGISIPFGISIIKWKNPTTFQSVPILSSTPANVPVLSLNMNRNALLIQNNSTATAPDIAPTFFIGFNAQPQQGFAVAIAPLAGLLFDIITPRDSIYVLIAGGAGASQVIQGVVVQGTYAPL